MNILTKKITSKIMANPKLRNIALNNLDSLVKQKVVTPKTILNTTFEEIQRHKNNTH